METHRQAPTRSTESYQAGPKRSDGANPAEDGDGRSSKAARISTGIGLRLDCVLGCCESNQLLGAPAEGAGFGAGCHGGGLAGDSQVTLSPRDVLTETQIASETTFFSFK